MARLLPLTLLLFTLLAPGARAECTCLWQGPFAEVQADTDLVVAVRVETMVGNSIDLEILQTLRGTPDNYPLRLWLDPGNTCRAEVGTFPLDSTWVMALERIDDVPPGGFNPHTPNESFGRIGDFTVSRCGGYWLSLSDNLVRGNLTGGPRWEMAPEMSPVLLDLVASYVQGEIDVKVLREAAEVDPALQQLILETRVFLRRQRSGSLPE